MWAGAWLKSPRTTGEKLKGLLVSGVACTVAGLLLQWLQICPIVKRIWTSSYTLFSGGLVLLMLAGFYAAIDFKGWKRWSFPLMVIGANSIAIYVMAWTMEAFVQRSLQIHFGSAPFLVFGAPFEPVLRGIGVLLVFWSILYWMYRKSIFIKI
jgi:predicted acyltransferase